MRESKIKEKKKRKLYKEREKEINLEKERRRDIFLSHGWALNNILSEERIRISDWRRKFVFK